MMTLEIGRTRGKDEELENGVKCVRIPMPPRHPKQLRQLSQTPVADKSLNAQEITKDAQSSNSEHIEATFPQDIVSCHVASNESVTSDKFLPKCSPAPKKPTAFEDISLLSSLDNCAIQNASVENCISKNQTKINEDSSSVNHIHEKTTNQLKHIVTINKYKTAGCSSSDSSCDSRARPTSRRARKRLRKRPTKTLHSHKVPLLPPPPGSKTGNLKHRRSIDINQSQIHIDGKVPKSDESQIQPSVSTPTASIASTISYRAKNGSETALILSPENVDSKMRLPGLGTKHSLSLSSDETDHSTTPYTPLLATPDLKIEILEADEQRRLSIIGAPFFPPGFPNFPAVDMTPEEMHAFDMRWGSPHHARGVKSMSRPTLLALPQSRPRMTSLPNREDYDDEDDDDCYRIRHFSIAGRRVVNRGDSFKSRRTKSNNSVASDVSSNEGWIWSHPCSLATSAASSLASSRASSASEYVFPFRVVMLGGVGVGKTTLCHQFMTSEHINAYDSSLDEEYGEKSISVILDGEESEILFVDHPADEMSIENYLATYNPHAIVLVFSVIDQQSFYRAEETLQYLWRHDVMATKGVILVANKTDLVRNRCVTQKESSSLADSYGCKFIETSSGLNHQVDELLVGVLKQIRLKMKNGEGVKEGHRRKGSRRKKFRGTKTSASLKVKSLLTKVCGKEIKSKSCENLHVL